MSILEDAVAAEDTIAHYSGEILDARNSIRRAFLSCYESIVERYELLGESYAYQRNKIFVLLYDSIYTAREDDPEEKLFAYLRKISANKKRS